MINILLEGFDIDALKAYLGNITSVNVNGKDYAASGRGSVVIINKDGTIKTDADPFKDAVAGTEFQITVASTGYTTPLTFTYKIAETPAPAEVDTTALEAAIAEADNLKEADYTAESWKAFETALNAAKETAADKDAAQTEVDNALNVLNAAVAKLEKVKDPNQQQPVQPQPEQTKPDKTTPQTGDRTNAALLFGCAVLSGAGVFFAYRRRRTIK